MYSNTDVYFLAVTCPELDISSHEGVRFTKQNDTVVFSCDPGLVLAGNTSMECLIDGSWTGLIPNCYKPGDYTIIIYGLGHKFKSARKLTH